MQTKTVCFTGKRPNKLYGYDKGGDYEYLFDTIYFVCKHLYLRYNVRQFITGGAQGTDQLAFWAVQQLAQRHQDIKNIVYIPFEGQEARWSVCGLFGQTGYREMLRSASYVRVVSDTSSSGAFLMRNKLMVDHSDAVIAVYDGKLSGCTEQTVNYAKSLGKRVIVIDPITQLI